ncbi:MAG: hypothetical protein H6709_00210 [Kofleriaceae bacterium]|nr:hypothetical protein [Myxococcales bacterium]MCB9558953.1 hypothetical protein [Kofleriaceae bacterium]MCB9570489.1 hypothetical protein [Kofleriaceae bacterium]
MENTVSLMAKILGAHNVEAAGADARFAVEGAGGAMLKVSLEGRQQRFMAVLLDPTGVARCTVDLAPVAHVKDDPNFPGRVTLHIGKQLVHIDSRPTLAIEIVSVLDD